ncbi:hypothetical protein D3M54_11175 [Klebsiella pneumoniae]|nr:hypothetical protein [Klebsiella pneumoniae]OWF99086.1 hypothetical protein B4U21_36875 [Klebsiella pneumoniae]PYZ83818.1 hypothetical protein DNK75_21805 [Klebsiella pneumoniae]QAT07210.1 hypothetical protein CAK82_00680 [Klebsiella pneumoniae]HBY5341726.1 hypothetical protein [Klebsiella pneumoniae]
MLGERRGSRKAKIPLRFPRAGFLNLAPLTGLELHLHLLLLLPLLNIAIFLPTYLPSLLFSCGKNVN